MSIPVLIAEGKTLPEVWEKAVIETWDKGLNIKTEYDKKDDPPSKDCTMIMVVNEPMGEPRIHRAFPGSLEDLEIYRQEVVMGIHDHWINPDEGKWTYTYHKRLFEYGAKEGPIRQIDYIVDKLSSNWYSRRAQAITWDPKLDVNTDDPPCLQRLWCRLVEKENYFLLETNTHWRSRDAYKAAFMNMFALTDLARTIAENISNRIKKRVLLGRYVDMSDSFHIYGSYHKEFRNFRKLIESRSFKERTWNSEFASSYFEEARKKLLEEKSKEKSEFVN